MPNILAWDEIAFLRAYTLALVVAIALAYWLRHLLRGPSQTAASVDGLSPYEVAYLAAGADRASEAAVVAIIRRCVLAPHYEPNEPHDVEALRRAKLAIVGQLSRDGDPLELAICHSIDSGDDSLDFLDNDWPAWDELRESLIERRLQMSTVRAFFAQVVPLAPVLAVLVPGLARIAVDVVRSSDALSPILVTLVASLASAGLWFRAVRTRAGDAAVYRLHRQHTKLRNQPRQMEKAAPETIAMIVALFGLGAIFPPQDEGQPLV